jgi:hypothetical protein
MATYDYGAPIYMTINASDITPEINNLVQTSIDHAKEHNSTLYVVINSGKPPDPPLPPGGN